MATPAREAFQIPDHVPPELVHHVGITEAPEFLADPYAFFKKLAADYPPVFYSVGSHGGSWHFLKHADAFRMLRDAEYFSNEGGTPFPRDPADPFKFIPIEIDPPDHRKYRAILDPVFSPQGIQRLERELGFPLFERSRRGMKLTAVAEQFHERTRALRTGLGDAMKEAADLHLGALGVLAAADIVGRGSYLPHPPDVLAFTVVPISTILIFAVLIALAYRARRDAPAHKRLILLAMSSVIVAALARWPFPWMFRNVAHATLVSFFFIAALVLYDLWSTHKIHRVTLWGGLFVIVVEETREMIGATAHWHAIARWMQSWNL